MEPARATWSDERLDDLSRRVDDGFNRNDAEMRELRREMHELRGEMNARFDAMQRTMLQVGGGMTATFLVGFIGVIATQL